MRLLFGCYSLSAHPEQHPKWELQQQCTARAGGQRCVSFALHSSDIVGKGLVLTSPLRDRLPCWVCLWENSSSLAGECDPVAGVLTARGCGAPAGPPCPSEGLGSRSADAARSGPADVWAPACDQDSTASRWLHAGDTLQRTTGFSPLTVPPALRSAGFPGAQEHKAAMPTSGSPASRCSSSHGCEQVSGCRGVGVHQKPASPAVSTSHCRAFWARSRQ